MHGMHTPLLRVSASAIQKKTGVFLDLVLVREEGETGLPNTVDGCRARSAYRRSSHLLQPLQPGVSYFWVGESKGMSRPRADADAWGGREVIFSSSFFLPRKCL